MFRSRNGLKTLGLQSKQHAAHAPIRHISLVSALAYAILKSLKLNNPKIISQGSSNCGGAPDCQGCLFMPRNRPFLLHLTFTYCFIFQSPEHLPTFLSIVGLYDGKKHHSVPINLLVNYYLPPITHDKTFVTIFVFCK